MDHLVTICFIMKLLTPQSTASSVSLVKIDSAQYPQLNTFFRFSDLCAFFKGTILLSPVAAAIILYIDSD